MDDKASNWKFITINLGRRINVLCIRGYKAQLLNLDRCKRVLIELYIHSYRRYYQFLAFFGYCQDDEHNSAYVKNTTNVNVYI